MFQWSLQVNIFIHLNTGCPPEKILGLGHPVFTCFLSRSGPGKVLIHSINIRGSPCVGEGCSGPGVGVKLNLTGEVIGEFLSGVPCTTNVLELTEDNIITYDGKNADGSEDENEKKKMGACFKV